MEEKKKGDFNGDVLLKQADKPIPLYIFNCCNWLCLEHIYAKLDDESKVKTRTKLSFVKVKRISVHYIH